MDAVGHLADGLFITPQSCVHPIPEDDAAVLHGDAASCNAVGFVPPRVPSQNPRVPRDPCASSAFSAIDRLLRGHGVMTGLIFALRHSSVYFFEISRWGDKLRCSAGRAGAVGPGGQRTALAPRVSALGAVPHRAGAPSSPGAFSPPFFLPAAFLCDPKQTARSLPDLVNDLGDKTLP